MTRQQAALANSLKDSHSFSISASSNQTWSGEVRSRTHGNTILPQASSARCLPHRSAHADQRAGRLL